MKENIKKWIFIIFRFLFVIILIYKPQNSENIYYAEVVIFISFELFGILVFYIKKSYTKYLKKIIGGYLISCFLLVELFHYFMKICIEWFITIITIGTIILILILFIYSIIKKNKFYFGYTILELFWLIIFIFLNILSTVPELSTLRLTKIHIFLAYIVVSFLYFPLLKKNEKYKNKESK